MKGAAIGCGLISCLLMLGACVDLGGDGGGNNSNVNGNANDDGSNGNQNPNDNDSGGANDNGAANDNSNGNDNTGGNGNDNADTNGAATCDAIDLSGAWIQQMNALTITQNGDAVTSTFDAAFECDPEDGSGELFETVDDFQATVDGCDITGTINVCRFGCDDQSDFECGIVELSMTGTIDSSGDQFEINVTDPATDDSLNLVYQRAP